MHGSVIAGTVHRTFHSLQFERLEEDHNEFEIVISPNTISPSIRLDVGPKQSRRATYITPDSLLSPESEWIAICSEKCR
jgi:hypothetical protein